ncbi:MAG: leucine-rich repeat domain-containing protein [Candidatus Fimenecus sp.]
MKKLLAIFLAVLMVIFSFLLTVISSFAATSGDFEYEVISEEDKTCAIIGYTGTAAELEIPREMDGYVVTAIDDFVFEDCESLESVTIPDSVTSIGEDLFWGCTSLTTINVSADNTAYTSVDGVLFNKDMTDLIQYPIGNARTAYVIPNGVINITDYLLWGCTTLKNLTIPYSVTSIGENALWRCMSLESINVSGDNTAYSSVDGVLFNKDKTELLQYPVGSTRTAYSIPNGVTSISGYSFPECASIESITIPDSVTSIGELAFAACPSLKSVAMGGGLKTIGEYAFAWCKALTSVKIPYGVTTIDDSAFDSCTSLESITFPDSVTSIGQNAIWGTAYYNDETNWENNVLYVDNHLIQAKYAISGDYVIKDGVITIAYSAFSNCESLESVTIPESAVTVGKLGFYKCTSLKNITIPDSVTTVDERAFGYCTSLEKAVIGAGVSYIGEGAFRSCKSLKSIEVSDKNSSFTSVDGVLFNKDKTELIQYPAGSPNTTYTIPDSVTTIGYRAFDFSESLESIVISDSLTYIGENAFKNCTALKDVYYKGTEEQWNEVIIETDSTFENVNIHYNYGNDAGEDSTLDEEPGSTETPDASVDNPVIIPDTGNISSISIATAALIAGAAFIAGVALVLTGKKRDDAESILHNI